LVEEEKSVKQKFTTHQFNVANPESELLYALPKDKVYLVLLLWKVRVMLHMLLYVYGSML